MNTEHEIRSFKGANAFLSNFFPARVEHESYVYDTVEHAYQAAKTQDPDYRHLIAYAATPGIAKRIGRQVPLREGWDAMKLSVMEQLLRQKFAVEPLRGRLLSTTGLVLVEGNTWGDTYWGVCKGRGHNHLGRLLMQVRSELIAQPRASAPPADVLVARSCILHGDPHTPARRSR